MAPLIHSAYEVARGISDIGGDISDAVNSGVDGASGVAATAQAGAEGAAATATAAVAGAAATASAAVGGAIATATSAYANATGMLGMLNKIEKLISTLEGYWDKYKFWIEFGIIAFLAIVVLSILYCCFHCWFDCFHFCCCCLKCTYKLERCCWRCCAWCCNANHRRAAGKEWHLLSRFCLWTVPQHVKVAQEKRHGDLRAGWCDTTHVARGCGKVGLSNDPVDRARWHWWGKEGAEGEPRGWRERNIDRARRCVGAGENKATWIRASTRAGKESSEEKGGWKPSKRLQRELDRAQLRNVHFTKLSQGLDAWGEKVGHKAHDGIHKGWAENVDVLHRLGRAMGKKDGESNVVYDRYTLDAEVGDNDKNKNSGEGGRARGRGRSREQEKKGEEMDASDAETAVDSDESDAETAVESDGEGQGHGRTRR